VALRYSYLDLDNAGIEGGKLQDITVGLNWYLNPNARFMANYILAHRDGVGAAGDGWAQLLGLRVQWDF
jgi:phosphate-selective porin OprO/OprP